MLTRCVELQAKWQRNGRLDFPLLSTMSPWRIRDWADSPSVVAFSLCRQARSRGLRRPVRLPSVDEAVNDH